MSNSHSYKCADYPGMEDCPFHVTTATEDEVWQQMELHARAAHGENPGDWSAEDRTYLGTLITSD